MFGYDGQIANAFSDQEHFDSSTESQIENLVFSMDSATSHPTLF